MFWVLLSNASEGDREVGYDEPEELEEYTGTCSGANDDDNGCCGGDSSDDETRDGGEAFWRCWERLDFDE